MPQAEESLRGARSKPARHASASLLDPADGGVALASLRMTVEDRRFVAEGSVCGDTRWRK
jgi:hypothetical protein